MISQGAIYQIVHTLDGQIYHLDEHLKLLFEAYYELFSGCLKFEKPLIEEQIKEVITRSRCPKGISLFVRIWVSKSGKITAGEIQRSFYEGYTMRCIAPRAITVDYSMPHIEYPTPLREGLIDWANTEARRQGAHLALRCHNGRVDIANGAQIFGISENGEVTTAKVSYSVEHRLVKDLIRSMDFTLTEVEGGIPLEALHGFEELFYADHNGITALRSCNKRGYMSVTTNTIAELLRLGDC